MLTHAAKLHARGEELLHSRLATRIRFAAGCVGIRTRLVKLEVRFKRREVRGSPPDCRIVRLNRFAG
jgi:hypothetical protein